jgi:hypothetical protein
VDGKTTIVLPGERPESWNKHWQSKHWTQRKKERDRVHLVVRSAIDVDTAALYEGQVDIVITAFYETTGRSQQIDSPNVVNKPYIDALIGWYLVDDDPIHLRYVTTGSFIDNKNPRTIIEIIPVE